MNQRISITLDVSKIDKTKITERKFKDKQGVEQTIKELKLDIVPLKEEKILKDGETWTLVKTHFVSMQQSKEDRAKGTKSVIIGDGIEIRDKKGTKAVDNFVF